MKRQVKYLKIVEKIKQSIIQGQLKTGEKLPSSRQLSRDFQVHRNTILAALEELKAQGWILTEQRRFYYVNSDLPTKYFIKENTEQHKFSSPHKLRVVKKLSPLTTSSRNKKIEYDFSSGKPDFRLFPVNEFKSFLSSSLKDSKNELLNYTTPIGSENLRSAIRDYLRKVRNLTDKELVITNGSQESIYIISQLFLKEGDYAAVEGIGYIPAIESIRSTGAYIKAIKVDQYGINPEHLEKVLSKYKIRLLYLTPLHQYPTTVTLPLERRAKIYQLAKKHNFIIIEDDYDHEYHYQGQPLTPMAANDPHQIIMYVSSFSKLLFPSLRVGFLAIPKHLLRYVSNYKKLLNQQSNTIIQDAIAIWMQSGGFERHLKRTRKAYHLRRDTICESIDQLIQQGFKLSHTKPNGGMAIWLKTQRNSGELFEDCLEKGIFLLPESNCRLTTIKNPNHIRLGFAGQTEDELKKGIKSLSSLL